MKTIFKTNTNILRLLFALTLVLSSCSNDDSEAYRNYVNIPDENFEQRLVDLGIDSNGMDGTLLKSDAENTTRLDIENLEITSIEGIEAFIDLEELLIGGNSIEQVDVSNNAALKIFVSFGNLFTSLDVRASNNLTALVILGNPLLTELKLGSHPSLETINIGRAQLEALDLSPYENLKNILISNTSLQSLNVSNGNNVSVEMFRSLNNDNLNCIEVQNVVYSMMNWPDVDEHTEYSLDCQ